MMKKYYSISISNTLPVIKIKESQQWILSCNESKTQEIFITIHQQSIRIVAFRIRTINLRYEFLNIFKILYLIYFTYVFVYRIFYS